MRFQFRLDMFNAFNHTNFYAPNTNLVAVHSGPLQHVQSAADAGSSQALLVMRGEQSGLLLLSAIVCCVFCRGSHPRNKPINLNRSWPRRKKPRPGAISNLLPNSTGKRQLSILKSPNSKPIWA